MERPVMTDDKAQRQIITSHESPIRDVFERSRVAVAETASSPVRLTAVGEPAALERAFPGIAQGVGSVIQIGPMHFRITSRTAKQPFSGPETFEVELFWLGTELS
jgi:hypothetical protein